MKKETTVLFVTKFDIHKGYSLIYNSPSAFSLDGIEYKAIPSGLHQSAFDIIRFKFQHCSDNSCNGGEGPDKFYYDGAAIFRQNGMNQDIDPNNRKTIKMYSVGILGKQLTQHYGDEITQLLAKFDRMLKSYINNDTITEDVFVEELSNLFKEFSSREDFGNTIVLKHHRSSNVLYNQQYTFDLIFGYTGPTYYKLWKYVMNNNRILIINHFDKSNTCGNQNVININTLLINYLIQTAKSSSRHLSSQGKQHSIALYNITLQDLGDLKKLSSSKAIGYVASTSDDIIATKLDLFDYLLEFDLLDRKPILKKITSTIVESNPGSYARNNYAVHELKFNHYDLNNFMEFKLHINNIIKEHFSTQEASSMISGITDWNLFVDNSWSSLLNYWIYGRYKVLPNINNYGIVDETKLFNDLKSKTITANLLLPLPSSSTEGGNSASDTTVVALERNEDLVNYSSSIDINSITDELVTNHFSNLAQHFQKSVVKLIENFDEDESSRASIMQYYNDNDCADGTDAARVTLTDTNGTTSNRHHLFETFEDSRHLDDEGLPVIELSYSDMHQLDLNPFANDDKEFIEEYVKNYLNRTVKVVGAFDFLSVRQMFCC